VKENDQKNGEKSNKLNEIARSYGNYMNIVCDSTLRIQDSFREPLSELQHQAIGY
jgi:hypothetical protein